jgi:hypothetical protein
MWQRDNRRINARSNTVFETGHAEHRYNTSFVCASGTIVWTANTKRGRILDRRIAHIHARFQ